MTRPTKNFGYVDVLGTADHGYAVITGADDSISDLDVGGVSDMDSIGVWAIGRRSQSKVTNVHVVACKKVEMGILAVYGF